ncbi:hypothetical protein GCM10028803_45750 [Larkinella knui]|uniref:Uncharacterized protein n=1 Tax=Larkinella knui TaxID=2025310 RepID=A0A3P1CQE1_9BACT|nr:hypothetical protein [Larkinella knui]RRB15174.1 hypothetical protein EHT87_11560 [Larkinella knui]
MSRRSLVYLSLLLPLLLATCKPDHDKPAVVVGVPGTSLPGGSSAATVLPKLLEMTVEGIPKENINIDEAKKEVTVIVPTAIASRLPATMFRVTDSARVVRPMGLDLLHPGSIDLNIGGLPTTNVSYKILLKPAGDLAIGSIPTPFVYETGSRLGLPIYNFYDGSYTTYLVLTRKGSGEVTKINVFDYPSASSTQIVDPLLFWPLIEQYAIPPGEYAVEIQKENGRKATLSQPLLVKRGAPKLSFNGNYVMGTPNRNVALGGVNLFGDEQLEVQLIDADGRESRIKPAEYDADGKWLKVALPEDTPAGYYALQLVRKGQVTAEYLRLPVINSPVQPYFSGLEGYTFDPYAKAPVVVNRAKSYRFGIGPYCLLQSKLKFIRVDNPLVEGSVEVVEGGNCEIGTSALSFTIPATFAPGRYLLVLEGTTYSKLNVRSEPFERIIEVR